MVRDLQHQLFRADLSTGETHYSAHHCAIIKTSPMKTSSKYVLAHQVYEKSISKVYHSTDKAFLTMTLPYLADRCIAVKLEVWHCLTVRPTGVLHNSESKKVCGREQHSCCGKMVACYFCSADTIDKKEQSKYCCD